jgi:hypothetical protein
VHVCPCYLNSIVGIATVRAVRVRFVAGARDFCLLQSVQTDSEDHPASCPVDTGSSFPAGKKARSVKLTTHLDVVTKYRMVELYIHSSIRLYGVVCLILIKHSGNFIVFFLWLYSPIQALAASMKLSVSLQLLYLGQSVGLLGRAMSCRKASTCTQTQKNAHTTHTKHPCPE